MKYLLLMTMQQAKLEKEIKFKEEEVYAALMSKGLNNYFKKTIEVEAVKPVSTPNHNTLCGAPGCYSNCDTTCTLHKSHDQEDFKKCKAMGGRETCK